MSNELVAALVLVALLAAAAIAAWLWRRRRRRIPRRRRRARVRPPLPVVLVHGLFGFDEIGVGSFRRAYFRGIGPVLGKKGRRVVHARLASVGSIETRARELADCIRGLEEKRAIVLAHSMGGLDARHAIARLGLAGRVAALVTVGTPHRGTPVAELTTDLAARLGIAGFGLEALRALTRDRMERFNEETPDVRSVSYASVVGSVKRRRLANPLLIPSLLWLAEREGASDGVVPASSQRWGEVLAEIDADHWAQIGWSRHFNAGRFYLRLVRELEASGI